MVKAYQSRTATFNEYSKINYHGKKELLFTKQIDLKWIKKIIEFVFCRFFRSVVDKIKVENGWVQIIIATLTIVVNNY